jgi:hypothetical protein
MFFLGILAVGMILGSYALGAYGIWSFDSRAYNRVQLVAGAVSVLVMAYAQQWPYVILNVAWATIAAVKLVSLRRK